MTATGAWVPGRPWALRFLGPWGSARGRDWYRGIA